ncbi:ABC transporter ATP-binding protein/permease [Kytococcus sp. Marseille-QA3725]
MSRRVPPLRLATTAGEQTVAPTPEGLLVGRGGNSRVVVVGDGVSREHVRIGHDGSTWWVLDAGSSRGTTLDGTPVTSRTPLRDGSELGLGPERRLTVRIDGPGATTEAPAGPRGANTSLPRSRPGQVLTVGRDDDNDVVVDDLLASRHHARLVATDNGFQLQDLSSRNGTYLDGSRVQTATVRPGQRISIGHAELTVRPGPQLVHGAEDQPVSFAAENLRVEGRKGSVRLNDVSFSLPPGSLVAVIGPSGAGKSTLLNALTGSRPATSGTVQYAGRDLYASYDELKQRIGIVPQDDIVHRQLTVRAALGYSAELRFPDDVSAAERKGEVERVMGELGLTEHADKRIDQLSGGQRKRVSVAMELLTKPSLIFLDEPTSGLDPGMDLSLMRNLRKLADDGRTVLVITHSTENLNLADRVFALAPGGTLAYQGAPDGLMDFFDARTMPEVFTRLADPSITHAPSASTGGLSTTAPEETVHSEAPRQQSAWRQFSTVARRQLRVMASDPGYLALTLLMPVALGLLTWLVPGENVFNPPEPGAEPSSSSLQVIMILAIGAAFMGVSGTVRELVGERPIFVREQAVGLRPSAYLLAKAVLATVVVFLQCTIMVPLSLLGTGLPEFHILAPSILELTLAMGLCAAACTAMGLVISATTRSTEQVMPAMVVSIMIMLVLSGGLFPLNDRAGLEQVAWLSPTRWGFAMGASSVDVRGLTPNAAPDPLWAHGLDVYTACALACLTLYVLLAGIAWLLVERSARRS